MSSKQSTRRNIQSRKELFEFLQGQMQTSYRDLLDRQRLQNESTLIKSYIFEANHRDDTPDNVVGSLFSVQEKPPTVLTKEEQGFFEVILHHQRRDITLYLDTETNERYWLGFSISRSQDLDWWFHTAARLHSDLDLVWLWPKFLEGVQGRGYPRGFGLDYDHRKFQDGDDEVTSYLKMQLWGGDDTKELYRLLRTHPHFRDMVVLSKVRLKELADESEPDAFAIQDIKYTGKFTTRGTDIATHLSTLNKVRDDYQQKIEAIEDKYALKWREVEHGRFALEGYAIHFIPERVNIPIESFYENVLDGTYPFRLLGIVRQVTKYQAIAEAVDLHTGGKLSFEIYPDMISVYLAENTCGNSIARLYTNLQHHFSVELRVEADNGDTIF